MQNPPQGAGREEFLLPPRILVVDDESQIHASIRLRLGKDFEIVSCLGAQEALGKLPQTRFDLCLVDIHMPDMDGLAFVEAVQKLDPGLGCVILSAFDNDDNLRRAIPLQVYDFIAKPLPERRLFEGCIPDWVNRTRHRRRELSLAQHAATLATERESAQLEREVEFVAAETARDALMQTANLLTTIHAHLVTAISVLSARGRPDPALAQMFRNLEEARKTTDAARSVAEGFFDSGYGSRDSSPALVHEGVRHAISIATRMNRADEGNKAVESGAIDERLVIRGLSGIEFLLMLVPALSASIVAATPNTTVGVGIEYLSRLESATRDPRGREMLWVNRRGAQTGHAGVVISLSASGPALTRGEAEAWLKGAYPPFASITPRGMINGLGRCHGLLGIALNPPCAQFRLALVLPA